MFDISLHIFYYFYVSKMSMNIVYYIVIKILNNFN